MSNFVLLCEQCHEDAHRRTVARGPNAEMTGENYPEDWETIRQQVLEQHLNWCVNCQRTDPSLQIHHIVPVEQGGSHQPSNLVPLCSQCHKAAHGKTMAPRIRWYTNGELSNDEFGHHLSLWKRMRDQLGVPRYDPDDDSVYVPLADADEIIDRMNT